MKNENKVSKQEKRNRRQASKTYLLFFVYFLLLFSKTVHAQKETTESDKNKIIFKGNHFSFEYSKLVAPKANISKQTGNYPISSSSVPGSKLGLLYHINFNSQYSLNIGAEAIIEGTNFILTFYKNDFSPPLNQDYFFTGKQTRAGNLLIRVPLIVEKRFWYAEKNFISIEAGIGINYSTGSDLDSRGYIVENSNDSVFQVAKINVDANNNAKPWISYLLSVAHSWRLKNNNYLQLGFGSNLSFTKYLNGTYSITIPDKPLTSGSYSSTGTYNALFLRYTLTNGNYHLRRQYEHINSKSF